MRKTKFNLYHSIDLNWIDKLLNEVVFNNQPLKIHGYLGAKPLKTTSFEKGHARLT
jgi:hypothetical protein